MTPGIEIRIGKKLRNGSVRYVVRPIEWLWVGILGAASAALGWVSVSSSGSWFALVIWVLFPLGIAYHGGFDVDPEKRETRVWMAFGFLRFPWFTVPSSELPQTRSAIETHVDSEHRESSARVTRLYWGSRNLRVGLPPDALKKLLAEAKKVARSKVTEA